MSNRTNSTASKDIVFVPLNRLKKLPKNVRKIPHAKADIAALAASIGAIGMLQYPVVEPEVGSKGKPTGDYLVNAGEGRRLAQLLRAKRKEIKSDEPKVTFLHYPFPPLLPLRYQEPIPLLSVKEILATKAYTIGRRGEFKDYVDLYAGVKGGHATLREIIDLSKRKYADGFNDRLFLEQLLYLDDVPDAPIMFLGKPISREDIERYFSEAISQLKLAA